MSPSSPRPSIGAARRSSTRNEVRGWLQQREHSSSRPSRDAPLHYSPRPSAQMSRNFQARSGQSRDLLRDVVDDALVEESLVTNDATVLERSFRHLKDFSTQGLRCLLYGYRFVDQHEYQSWKKTYQDATTSLINRTRLIEEAGELIERDLELGGATAIEDKLQEGVPETIDRLRRANIKMWMLTGDKRETAINIGHACRLIKDFSTVSILDSESSRVEQSITSAIFNINEGNVAHSVIVIDGKTLGMIQSQEILHGLFLDLAILADSVICCRASPSQKASLVHSIRRHVNHSVTLAIGDGANDIAMIQEAHVGIGLTGKEGLQAARVSDYAIAQFRFLNKLLLVHGRWNYIRTAKYTVATFWKEMVRSSDPTLLLTYTSNANFTPALLSHSGSISALERLYRHISIRTVEFEPVQHLIYVSTRHLSWYLRERPCRLDSHCST